MDPNLSEANRFAGLRKVQDYNNDSVVASGGANEDATPSIDVRRVIHEYEATSGMELSISKDDLIVVEGPPSSRDRNMISGRVARTTRKGLVPLSCLSAPLRGVNTELQAYNLNKMLSSVLKGADPNPGSAGNLAEYYYEYYYGDEESRADAPPESLAGLTRVRETVESDDSFTDSESEEEPSSWPDAIEEQRITEDVSNEVRAEAFEDVQIAKVTSEHIFFVGNNRQILEKGEYVSVVDVSNQKNEMNHDLFLVARRKMSNSVAFIPESKLQMIPDLFCQPWYLGSLSLEASNSLILADGVPNSTFLVRDANNRKEDGTQQQYMICLRHGDQVKYRKVDRIGGEYRLVGDFRFSSINELIDFHSTCSDKSLRIGIPFNKLSANMKQPPPPSSETKGSVSYLRERIEEAFRESSYSPPQNTELRPPNSPPPTLPAMIQRQMQNLELKSERKSTHNIAKGGLPPSDNVENRAVRDQLALESDMSLEEQRKNINDIMRLQAQLMKESLGPTESQVHMGTDLQHTSYQSPNVYEKNVIPSANLYNAKSDVSNPVPINNTPPINEIPPIRDTPRKISIVFPVTDVKKTNKTPKSLFKSRKSGSHEKSSSSDGSSINSKKLTFTKSNSNFEFFDKTKTLVQKFEKSMSDEKTKRKIKSKIRSQWDINSSDIEWISNIGSGHYGEVWKGLWTGYNRDVAVKTLNTSSMSSTDFYLEATSMIRLRHPNLVKLFGVCLEPKKSFLVMEYHKRGSILDFFKGNNTLSVQRMDHIGYEVASGMSYLGDQGFIHRDLAARNVLLDQDLTAKIADFGLARCMKDLSADQQENLKMPWKWTAPESLVDPPNWSSKSDVWSYGVFLWELYSGGDTPYKDIRMKSSLLQALYSHFRMTNPMTSRNLIYEQVMLKCWDLQPQTRISFELIKPIMKAHF